MRATIVQHQTTHRTLSTTPELPRCVAIDHRPGERWRAGRERGEAVSMPPDSTRSCQLLENLQVTLRENLSSAVGAWKPRQIQKRRRV